MGSLPRRLDGTGKFTTRLIGASTHFAIVITAFSIGLSTTVLHF